MPKRLEEMSTDQHVAMIKELRQEAGNRRTALARYETLFSGLPPEISDAFLQIVNVYSGDRVAGAELMKDLSDRIISASDGDSQPPKEKEETMTDTSGTEGGDLAKILEFIEKQDERIEALEKEREGTMQVLQDRERQEAVAYLEKLGYKENGDEWGDIVNIAQSDIAGYDLDKADQIYRSIYGPPAGAEGAGEGGEGGDGGDDGASGDGDQDQSQDQGKETDGEDKGRKFPATAGRTNGLPGAPGKEADGELDLSKEAVEARVYEYLESVAGAQSG